MIRLKEGDKLDIKSKEGGVFLTVVHQDGELALEYNNKLYAINKIYNAIDDKKIFSDLLSKQ
ncbi:hypothetical protein LCGC14_2386080 [marine sediment metagenome]|uniref:Uncharacterized protein n=1 Tax=marine sediment metagenome TaxID=412755 RepID=A0A0F9BZJ9_9ZZZZ